MILYRYHNGTNTDTKFEKNMVPSTLPNLSIQYRTFGTLLHGYRFDHPKIFERESIIDLCVFTNIVFESYCNYVLQT